MLGILANRKQPLVGSLQRSRGVSLVELLIAMTIGAILMISILSIMISILNNSLNLRPSNKMTYEMQNTLNLIIADLRRAGFWTNAYTQIATNANTNPFLSATTNLSIPNSSCLLFTYDRNKNGVMGTTGTPSTNDHFGYRLSNGVVQALTSDQNFNCTAATSDWENITDSNSYTVTNLNFSLTPRVVSLPSGSTSTIRYLTVSMTAQLANDATTITTLSQAVRVRQDLHSP